MPVWTAESKGKFPMNITILTLGSRGDVQPYVALGVGLKAVGHNVTVCTGRNFESFITAHGLTYGFMDADFLQLMQDPATRKSLQGRGNPVKLMREVFDLLRRVLNDAWKAAQGSDAIIYHPKALAGYHIAEKLRIPAFVSAPVPLLTPTASFPSPLVPARMQLGPAFNRFSHAALLSMITLPYQRMINRWRRETLGLPPRRLFASERRINGQPVHVLYPFSRHVIPPPADWDEAVHVTGYWFLDDQAGWQPPQALLDFLDAGPAPVYIGFGSMSLNDPQATTHNVLAALEKTGQRGILATGWGGLSAADLPPNAFLLDAAPHDWLFPRMAAVVHHGGAGTTAAGLRAGLPTIICPFLGDQPFWGRRVHALGVGPAPIPQKRLNADNLAEAIRAATTDSAMRARAAALGERIRAEDGVGNAVAIVNRVVEAQQTRVR
ncbi:MAG: glycosyltransferase [Chloroflexota bacterium]